MKSTQLIHVDANNTPIGTIARTDLSEAIGYRTAHVLAFDNRGNVFLQIIGNEHERSPMRWGSTAATHVRKDETPRQATVRALSEEVGCNHAALSHLGTIQLADKGRIKFVYIYRTQAEHLSVTKPGHVHAIKRIPRGSILSSQIFSRLTSTTQAVVRYIAKHSN